MSGRIKGLIAATVLAAIVLLVTLLAGPKGPPARPRLSQQQLNQLDLNRRFDATPGETDRQAFDRSLSAESGSGVFRIPDPDSNRVTWLYWDRITPLDTPGLNDMQHPLLRIVFSPQRVVQITSDRGVFQLNEQNQLQHGTLTGHVVLQLLETTDGSDVDLHSDRDLQLRVQLDEAEFDLELGELRSASPLRVTGPRVDFTGRGLNINYNQLHDRIDRLVVDRVDKFILLPAPTLTPGRGANPAPRTSTAPRSPQRPAVDFSPSAAPAAPTPAPQSAQRRQAAEPRHDASTPRQPTFYRARFEDNVVIDAVQRSTHMTGDYLDAVFRLERDEASSTAQTSSESKRTVKSDGLNNGKAVPKQKVAADKPTPQPKPMLVDAEDQSQGEVHIQCTGRLIMEPESNPDAQLLEHPDAVLLALIGAQKPVQLKTDEGETVTGQRIDYLTTTGRMCAYASGDKMPMHISSAQLGDLSGRQLMLDPTAATGYVQGPGVLDAHTGQGEKDQPLRMTWRDQLDLTFFTDRQGSGPPRMAAIRSAAFHGDAAVDHPDLHLAADTLTAQLERTGGTRQSHLTGIDAEGRAQLIARDATKDQQIAMTSDALHVDMTTDAQGREQPSHLHASGGVVAEQPGMVMHTETLDAQLGESDEDQRLTLLSMEATGGVTVDTSDPQPKAKLVGERMVLDAVGRQMELFGSGATPARAIRDDGELSGMHLVMEDKTQAVHAVGPGVFTFVTRGETGDQPPRKLTVTWSQSMLFDQSSGLAHFVGAVASVAETDSDQSSLNCDDLRLNFEKVEGAVKANDQTGGLRIRTATAAGNPIFRSRSFMPQAPDTDLTRLRLDGPLMTFDNTPGVELIQVIGPGRMLLEDYRPQSPDAEKSQIANRKSQAVQVTGRGQTLFTWQKQMTIDSARRDMLMEGGVQMVHRPTGEDQKTFGDVVTMSCVKLLADFVDAPTTGGWSALGGEESAKLSIHMIVADRDVRIQQAGKKVICDRMVYLGEKNTVELAAARGHRVRIEDSSQPTPLVSEAFEWNLTTDEFNVTRPGALTVPLPQ